MAVTTEDPSTVRLAESGHTFELWKGSGGGAMRLDWTLQGALRVAMLGHGHHQPYVAAILRRSDAAARMASRPAFIVDFWDMQTYDSGFRVDWTAWAVKHRSSSDWYVYQRSKLVHMGLTVANLALGGILNIYDTKKGYDDICKKLGIPVSTGFPR